MAQYQFQDREGIVPVGRGDYIVGIETARLELSKKTGNEQIKCECRILLPEGKKGPMVYFYAGFSEKAVWGLDVFLKALQCAPKKGETLDVTDEWLKANVVGALGWASIGEKEWQGKKSNEITRWLVKPAGKQDAYELYGQVPTPVKTNPAEIPF